MDLDDILEDYETIWAIRVPSLEELKSTLEHFDPDGSSDSLDALCELVKVDIHHRWRLLEGPSTHDRNGSTSPPLIPVEEYVARFPTIEDRANYPEEFLIEELIARMRVGDFVSAESITERFPAVAQEKAERILAEALRTLDFDYGSDASTAPLDANATVGARFEIRHQLGQGSMGRVYLAFDPRLQREVAIKVPLTQVGADPIQRERFLREGRAAGSVAHPNMVRVYETGQTDEYFIVSEYVAGPNLKEWLLNNESLAPEMAAQLMLLQRHGR